MRMKQKQSYASIIKGELHSEEDDSVNIDELNSEEDASVTIEEVNSEEDEPYLIEEVISDDDAEKAADIVASEREHCMMTDMRLCIVGYIKHIGEDRGFFPNGIVDIEGAFDRWTALNHIVGENTCNWLRLRRVFIGSTSAIRMFKEPNRVMMNYAPYNMLARLPPFPKGRKQDMFFSTAHTNMGIEMENVIRESHVRFFSLPLKVAKPGQVVSTHHMVGAACTGDIELVDNKGQVVSLMEVKTLCTHTIPPGMMIPDTVIKAREVIRELLATRKQFCTFAKGRGNIFGNGKKFVDLKLLRSHGKMHAAEMMKTFAVHSHVPISRFLECMIKTDEQCVDIYFYKQGNRSGEPAQAFSMSMEKLGLAINPWSSTITQMVWQQCVYYNSSCKNVKRGPCAWMHLLVVVPYNTNSGNPQPYLIMKVPVSFSDELCKGVKDYFNKCLLDFISHSASSKRAFNKLG